MKSLPFHEKKMLLFTLKDKNVLWKLIEAHFSQLLLLMCFKNYSISMKPINQSSSVQLSDFQKNLIVINGICVKVIHKKFKAPLFNILGYTWFQTVGLRLVDVNVVHCDPVQEVAKKLEDISSEELGTYKGKLILLPIDSSVHLL